MKKNDNSSSVSDLMSDINYKNASEINTFKAKNSTVSSSEPYPTTTMKVTHNIRGDVEYSPKFSLNISNTSREEANYKLNQRLAGKDIITVSTKND
jgi:hypothetical protein